MYLRTTLLIVAIVAGGVFLARHPAGRSTVGMQRIIVNPYVEQEQPVSSREFWEIAGGGLALCAIVAAAWCDRLRRRRHADRTYTYFTPSPMALRDHEEEPSPPEPAQQSDVDRDSMLPGTHGD